MQKAIVLLAILVLASCQTVVPELPQQFKAKVVADLPFIGQVPGIFYYDYPNLRQRIDITQFGQYVIDLSMYAIATEYQIVSGSCASQDLTSEMYPMTVPPFAVFNGTTFLDNQPAQLWTADMLGIATLNYYVSSVVQNGKTLNTLLRFYAELPGGLYVSYDFSSITVGPPGNSFFDYTSFGCQSPVPPKTYSLSGYVKNSINNRIIAGATVQLSTGASTTSDSSGLYSFTGVVAGVYNVTVPTTANFYGSVVRVNVTGDVPAGTVADFNLSPVLPAGQWRIVLTWGAIPSDLDSYYYGPVGQCTVYYRVRTCNSTTSWGTLDVDARNGYGPETVTLYNFNGTYRVNIYSNDGLFPQSNARVQVYNSSGLVQDIRVPTSGYNTNAKTWTVFSLNGNALTLINTFA